MEFFDVVAQRHSYRGQFEETPVPREDLVRILEAGLAAPSGCNRQTTSLIALDDAALVAQVGGMLNKPNFASAPVAICVLTEPIETLPGRLFYVQDYAAAIENMLLAVTAMGYASCWVEGYVTGNDALNARMAEALGVPEGRKLVAYLPVGKAKEPGTQAQREPFESKAWFNGYGK